MKRHSTRFIVRGLMGALMLTSPLLQAQCPYVPNYANSYLNATNPNTIEYDNMVSTFHGTMARQADGRVLVWGESMANDGVSHVLTPQELNATNYPLLTGTVLKFAGSGRDIGFDQHVVLTTDGLFAWGFPGEVVTQEATNFVKSFKKLTVNGVVGGMPAGVSPANVKMLFGTNNALLMTTCSGNVYMLSGESWSENFGQGVVGGTTYSPVWYKIKTNATTDLSNVVAARGVSTLGTFVALKSDGTLWTWGKATYLGDNTAKGPRAYATQMAMPAGTSGKTPKMIGVINSTYYANPNDYSNPTIYLLFTDGTLYALGDNMVKQLGDFSSATENRSWVQVKKSTTAGDYLTNIAWISPNEHDRGEWATGINVLTNDGKIWAWGRNHYYTYGLPNSNPDINAPDNFNPTSYPGALTPADNILAVETGGHTSIIIKECSNQYGYVGHNVHGSMSDGSGIDGNQLTYNFTNTSLLDLAGAPSGAAALFPVAGAVYTGQQVPLNYAPAGGTFTVAPVTAGTVNPATGILTLTGTGNVTVTYNTTSPCPASSAISLNVLAPLPVQLLYFNVVKQDATALLNWATASEDNCRGFDIERSADGREWITIGFVNTEASNGNSTAKLTYTFTDQHPLNGQNRYRLKQFDRDGNHEHSSVKTLMFNRIKDNSISIYPNPFNEHINIAGLSGDETIKVYDINGKVIQMLRANRAGAMSISLNGYNEGVYYLVISAPNGAVITKNILKTE